MNRLSRWLASLAMAFALPVAAQTPAPVIVVNLADLTGAAAVAGQQLQQRRAARLQGDQRRRRNPEATHSARHLRHRDQSRSRQGAGAEGHRTAALRRHGAGVLVDDAGHDGRHEGRADPAVHRRRGGRDHAQRQPVHLSHVDDANGGDAARRQIHEGRRAYAHVGARHGQQRVRQGRARRDAEGRQGAGSQRRGRPRGRAAAGGLRATR